MLKISTVSYQEKSMDNYNNNGYDNGYNNNDNRNNNRNNNNNNNNNNNSNSNAGAGLSKTENADNTGDKEGWEKPQAARSES